MAHWAALVQGPEDEIPLDRSALLISACANPELDIDAELGRLADLAARVDEPDPSAVCVLLFDRLGLRGDDRTYHDPANSYLDRVLDRRRGIPISLSVLLIEVGRRCGVRLEPVGMPGHFLVRDPESPDLLIDAFYGGRRLDRSGCQQLLRSVAGPGAELTADMLVTTRPRMVLTRMLANLDRSFAERQDFGSLGWVNELRVRLPGRPAADRVHAARRLTELGQLEAAAAEFELLAADAAPGQVQDRLLGEAARIRARLN